MIAEPFDGDGPTSQVFLFEGGYFAPSANLHSSDAYASFHAADPESRWLGYHWGNSETNLWGVGDLDGDGRSEVLLSGFASVMPSDATTEAYLFFGAQIHRGSQLSTADAAAQFLSPGGHGGSGGMVWGRPTSMGDLDGDGLDELAFPEPFRHQPTRSGFVAYVLGHEWSQGGTHVFSSGSAFVGGTGMTCGAGATPIGDLDSDGLPELAISCSHEYSSLAGSETDEGGMIYALTAAQFLDPKTSQFFPETLSALVTGDPSSPYLGSSRFLDARDITGDGQPDLLLRSQSEVLGFSGADLRLVEPLSLDQAWLRIESTSAFNPPVLFASDIDRDGAMDVVLSGDGDDYPGLHLFLSSLGFEGGELTLEDDAVTVTATEQSLGLGHSAATGDFNGDGATDLLVGSKSDQAWLFLSPY